MYVRWRKRPGKTGGLDSYQFGFTTYSVILVESARTAKGPRQRVVAFLGSIRVWPSPDSGGGSPHTGTELPLPQGGVCYTDWDPFTRSAVGFWQDVRSKLAPLGCDDDQVAALEASIASVIPEPTRSDIRREQEYKKQREADLREWYAEKGMTAPF